MKTINVLSKPKAILILSIVTVILLLILPYYLFSGGLFLGGDDSKLYYIYPLEYIKHISFFSWLKVSSLGFNGPTQFNMPFLSVWLLLDYFIKSKVILDYLSFSLSLILGFIFFQRLIKELMPPRAGNGYFLEAFIGSLFYILSPILIVNQLAVFLTPVWLIGLIPIIIFYFIKYVKDGRFIYIFKNTIWCTIFSITLFTVPWILGLVISLTVGFGLSLYLYKKSEVITFLKKSLLFFGLLAVSQSFWLLPNILAILSSFLSNSSILTSPYYVGTFRPVVEATASGNIIYPLLNLFHYQIAADFGWQLNKVFVEYYNKTLLLNIIFVLILFAGILSYKRSLNKHERKIYLILIMSLMISLFLFTVNIGPLKDFFLVLGKIPGFLMFRNFSDKFAFGFIFLYSVIFSFSLIIIKRFRWRFYKILLLLTTLIIILNFVPVKSLVNAPLWTTKNTYGGINLPNEYTNFLADVGKKIQASDNVISLPLNIGSYAIFKDENSNRMYIGSSRFNLFTNSNDFSGDFSFLPSETKKLYRYMETKEYKKINEFLYKYNINYIFLTKNIPQEVKRSFLFNQSLLKYQNNDLIENLSSRKILSSSKGNYELYELKEQNTLLNTKNLYFQKVSPVKFRLYMKNIKNPQNLTFLDNFDPGWKIYIKKAPNSSWCKPSRVIGNVTECLFGNRLFDREDPFYLLDRSLFDNSHKIFDGYANQWILDSEYIKKNYDNSYYSVNKDGSTNIELVLYFRPQSYFYLGSIISVLFFAASGIILIRKSKSHDNL